LKVKKGMAVHPRRPAESFVKIALHVHKGRITDIEKGRCEMASLKWERVGSMDDFGGESTVTALRAKVPGGWLVKISDASEHFNVTFLPDPNHEWK
jgi:hypothetical protein